MTVESYITWDGKEENKEPESLDDIYIILARAYSRTTATWQCKNGKDDGNVICTSKIIGGWTKAFETLFANQEDPEFIDFVCSEIERNLVDEMKNFIEEIMAIFEHFECLECLAEISPLEVKIRYLWTSENRIRIEIQNDFISQLCHLQLMDEDETDPEMSNGECTPDLYAETDKVRNTETQDIASEPGTRKDETNAAASETTCFSEENDNARDEESEDEDDVIEELRELKKWLEVATELYFIHGGRACCHRWETFINMNFNNPEQFREMFESQMSIEE